MNLALKHESSSTHRHLRTQNLIDSLEEDKDVMDEAWKPVKEVNSPSSEVTMRPSASPDDGGRDVKRSSMRSTTSLISNFSRRKSQTQEEPVSCSTPPVWTMVQMVLTLFILIIVILAYVFIMHRRSSGGVPAKAEVKYPLLPVEPITQDEIVKIVPGLCLDQPKVEGDVATCQEANHTGVYNITVDGRQQRVLCHVDLDSKWTVFQRRLDGEENFFRNWAQYKEGFGRLDGEFWLGNELLHQLTSAGQSVLRVDMGDWKNIHYTVYYNVFKVDNEARKYKVHIAQFLSPTSAPGNGMANINNLPFVTYDTVLSGRNCPNQAGGGWWYRGCHTANPNGVYNCTYFGRGLNWMYWRGQNYSLKFFTLMLGSKQIELK